MTSFKNTLSQFKVKWLTTREKIKKRKSLSIFLNFLKYSFLILLLFILYVVSVEHNFLKLYGAMPGIERLKNPPMKLSSELYTADGILIGRYFNENRVPVKYHQISPNLINALIATEDVRFYQHQGIDFYAIGSVIYSSLSGNSRGGSTITQQLAKNLYNTRTKESEGRLYRIPFLRTFIIKTKEWMTAVKLENNFTKEEILTLYLNTVDFGSNAYGINTATKTYFNTSPDSVSIQQSAVLIGLLKATTLYSPVLNPNNAFNRKNVVLSQMTKYGLMERELFDSLKNEPITLNFKLHDKVEEAATYFKGAVNNYLNEWCEENGYNLYNDGLRIYTTIDSRYQQHAEEAIIENMKSLQKKFDQHWKGRNPWVDDKNREIPGYIEAVAQRTFRYRKLKEQFGDNEDTIQTILNTPVKMKVFSWEGEQDTTLSPLDSIRYYKKFLHAGMMTMDPFNGHVKAWVGGIDFRYFQYDHVMQGKRQPGSTFKPFVYVAAIDQGGYSPCDKMIDQRVTIRYEEDGEQKAWSPRNSDWVHSGSSMTLRRALGKSVNTITAQLTQKIGPEKVVEYASKMGIKSPIKPVPSVGFGSSDVSLYEMVGAYGTFVNEGKYTEPIFITRIEDSYGNLIHEFVPEQKQVISEESAFLMMHMLKGSIEEPGGTSQNLWSYNIFGNNDIAGKTGTTTNNSDGWFIGITKDLITGVWVGGDDRSIHFRTSALGEGSKTALPAYGIYMEKLYADKSLGIDKGRFPKPKVEISKKFHCPTILPKPDTLQVQEDRFKIEKVSIK
ncbi:MAG: transglycosylase domain-containing protein [Bacteroidota bacterium]|nr:transglycosylase domain-containing protein [Bacteroidota bacterium]